MSDIIGAIIIHSNAIFPNGWQLADGTNGTVDLRNVIPLGATDDDDLLDTGGSATHVHDNSATEEVDDHGHTVATFNSNAADGSIKATGGGTTYAAGGHRHPTSVSVTAAGAHDHPFSDTEPGSSLPPYKKLYYIQKVS